MCNGEAPGVEQFARQNASKLTVVGLGAKDTLALAKSFQSRHQLETVRLLWDGSGRSWAAYGVPGQPAALLVGANGKIKASWLGPVPYADVLKLV